MADEQPDKLDAGALLSTAGGSQLEALRTILYGDQARDFETRLDTMRDNLIKLGTQLEEVQAALRGELTRLEETAGSQLQTEVDTLREAINTANVELGAMRSAFQAEFETVRTDLEAVHTDIDAVRVDINAVRSELAAVADQQQSALEAVRGELTEQIQAVQQNSEQQLAEHISTLTGSTAAQFAQVSSQQQQAEERILNLETGKVSPQQLGEMLSELGQRLQGQAK